MENVLSRWFSGPVYYDLYETDGTVRRFVATAAANDRGRLVSVTDSRGVRVTPDDMGVDIVYGPDGVRQFLTPSRLADVTVSENGYDVVVYPIASAPVKDSSSGHYSVPSVEPVERLSVRSANDGNRAVITLVKAAGRRKSTPSIMSAVTGRSRVRRESKSAAAGRWRIRSARRP